MIFLLISYEKTFGGQFFDLGLTSFLQHVTSVEALISFCLWFVRNFCLGFPVFLYTVVFFVVFSFLKYTFYFFNLALFSL